MSNKKWHTGFLKDYTCALVWGSDIAKEYLLIHSLIGSSTDKTVILTCRKNGMWGRKVNKYKTEKELHIALEDTLFLRSNDNHINYILDLGVKLSQELNHKLSQFIKNKRSHNTTLIVLCNNLQYITYKCHFDLVFHTFPTTPEETKYQKWINDANKEGVLVTDSMFLPKKDSKYITQLSIIGTYVI